MNTELKEFLAIFSVILVFLLFFLIRFLIKYYRVKNLILKINESNAEALAQKVLDQDFSICSRLIKKYLQQGEEYEDFAFALLQIAVSQERNIITQDLNEYSRLLRDYQNEQYRIVLSDISKIKNDCYCPCNNKMFLKLLKELVNLNAV